LTTQHAANFAPFYFLYGPRYILNNELTVLLLNLVSMATVQEIHDNMTNICKTVRCVTMREVGTYSCLAHQLRARSQLNVVS